MNKNKNLVDVDLIHSMLYNDKAYVNEFANASIESFTEFNAGFKQYLLERDMDNLRRAGHKIKPVAQMLHLDPLLEMYEASKTMIDENAPTEKLNKQAKAMDKFCNQVLFEFKLLSDQSIQE